MAVSIRTNVNYVIEFSMLPLNDLWAKMNLIDDLANKHGVRKSFSQSLDHALDISWYKSGSPARFGFIGEPRKIAVFVEEVDKILNPAS